MKDNNKSGLATAGMILGIIAIVGSWIPFLNIGSIIMGVLAFVFGIIPLVKKKSIGKAVAGTVLGALSVIISIAMLVSASKAIDEALKPTTTSPSSSTESSEAKSAAFDGEAAYDKIANGMTKQEVRDIAGVDPQNCTASETAGIGKMETCSYGNVVKDNVVLSVSFTDGVVTSKLKTGNK
ncbi:MAG: hypothetical protein ACM3KF_03005 [Acidobacteriota bacterium]